MSCSSLRLKGALMNAAFFCASFFVAMLIVADSIHSASIPNVQVGNPNNPPDARVAGDFGTVAYPFRIGTTEVTNAQYVDFLNAVAKSDPFNLYNTSMGSDTRGGIVRAGSPGNFSYVVKPDAIGQGLGGGNYAYANKPVAYVSWFDALRFANWLHNGQGTADTEAGAYTLLGGTPIPTNAQSITRNPSALWFIPNVNEWYKAGHYNPVTASYFDYPTRTNTVPDNSLPSADTGNSANFQVIQTSTGNLLYPHTDAGAYARSVSPYGTYDQGGNVIEWTEVASLSNPDARNVKGGSYDRSALFLNGLIGGAYTATQESSDLGFRIAAVIPEPSTLLLLFVAFAVVGRHRRTS